MWECIEGKWHKPLGHYNSGMAGVLAEVLINSSFHQYDLGLGEQATNIRLDVHSYKEWGTSVVINVEVSYDCIWLNRRVVKFKRIIY